MTVFSKIFFGSLVTLLERSPGAMDESCISWRIFFHRYEIRRRQVVESAGNGCLPGRQFYTATLRDMIVR